MSLLGVCAVQADWIPKLLPQYCHFIGPEQSPAPWYCPVSGKVKCQQQSTFCKITPYPLTFSASVCPYLVVLIDEVWHFLARFINCVCIYICSQSWMEASCNWDGLSWRPWAIQTVRQVSVGRTGIVFESVGCKTPNLIYL